MTAASYSGASLQKGGEGGLLPTAGLFFPAGGGSARRGAGERSGRGLLQSFVLLFFGRKQ